MNQAFFLFSVEVQLSAFIPKINIVIELWLLRYQL